MANKKPPRERVKVSLQRIFEVILGNLPVIILMIISIIGWTAASGLVRRFTMLVYKALTLGIPFGLICVVMLASLLVASRYRRQPEKQDEQQEAPPYWFIHLGLGWEITPLNRLLADNWAKLKYGVKGPFCPKCRRLVVELPQSDLEPSSPDRLFACYDCKANYSLPRSLDRDVLKVMTYDEWEAEQRRKLPSA